MSKPILCLDFDGVLHSYTSGWKGAAVIPDEPVPGMVEFLEKAVSTFDVQIFSSRSGQGGIDAMRTWVTTHVTRHFDCEFHGGAPRDAARAYAILDALSYPTQKPPALVALDDRAIQFMGEWPSVQELRDFQPWNRRPVNRPARSRWARLKGGLWLLFCSEI